MVTRYEHKKIVLAIALALLVFVPVQQSRADLTAVGPIHLVNGYPEWYQDANGVQLRLPTDPALTIFDPVIPGNAFSEAIWFGGESFYYMADADLGIGFAEFALEAAFQTDDPAPDQQLVFARLRIRIDVPVTGTYIVTHPYGVRSYDVAAIVAGNEINDTVDEVVYQALPAPPLSVLNTPIPGPQYLQTFLVAASPVPNPGFLGAALGTQTVTGSPTGNNFVRLDGPAGSNIGGPGVDFIQVDQFGVSGQIFDPNAPNDAPLALAQSVSAPLNGEADITLNAIDPDGPPPITVAIARGPSNGSLTALNQATRQVTYVPNAGFAGSDSFTFTASDGVAVSAPATISITVVSAGGRRSILTPQLAMFLKPGLNNDRFSLRAGLTLSSASNGVNLLRDPVTIKIGRSSITIPGRSFVRAGPRVIRYVGEVDGVSLRVSIRAVGDGFTITAGGKGANLPAKSKVPVTINIGDDTAKKTIVAALTGSAR